MHTVITHQEWLTKDTEVRRSPMTNKTTAPTPSRKFNPRACFDESISSSPAPQSRQPRGRCHSVPIWSSTVPQLRRDHEHECGRLKFPLPRLGQTGSHRRTVNWRCGIHKHCPLASGNNQRRALDGSEEGRICK